VTQAHVKKVRFPTEGEMMHINDSDAKVPS